MKASFRALLTGACLLPAVMLISGPARAQTADLPDPLGIRASCVRPAPTDPQADFFRLLDSPDEVMAEIEAFKRRSIAATVVLDVNRCETADVCTELKSNGTGTVISADGLVLTAFHVIRGAVDVKATFRAVDADGYIVLTGRARTATVVAVAPNKDVALLKLERDEVPYPRLGLNCRWQALKRSLVWHFGKTTGRSYGQVTLQSTESVGVTGVYETTARADFGDSGAPFVKRTGEMIGILLSLNKDGARSYYMPVADAIGALEQAASVKK